MTAASLTGGFADAPLEAARAFRVAMNAMARPGSIGTLDFAAPPAPLSPAAGALLLTLCDADTPVHLASDRDTEEIRAWIAFHAGAPPSAPGEAAFATGSWEALQPLHRFPHGLPDYPDRSATLIVEMTSLAAEGAVLTGPGIRDSARMSLPEIEAFRRNRALFPRGLDFFFACGTRVAALPCSALVAEREDA